MTRCDMNDERLATRRRFAVVLRASVRDGRRVVGT